MLTPTPSDGAGPSARNPSRESLLAATRQSLLTRLKRPDDHDGWQRFFDTYGGVIHGMAMRAGLSQAEADDALQETLLSLCKEMPAFRYDPSRGSFKSWLFQITRRRIADQFRARARHSRATGDDWQTVTETEDPQSDSLARHWDEEWRQQRMQAAIDRVKIKVAPRQWQMFDLATLQHWPTERICQLLGISRAQLYMAKMRVGRMLKAEAASLPQEGPW